MKWTCILLAVLLSGCSMFSGESTEEPTTTHKPDTEISGAKAGAYTALQLHPLLGMKGGTRPSEMAGVFAAMHLSQEHFLRAGTATAGIDAQVNILSGQRSVQQSEAFSLLSELGTLLETNIPDLLNRSTDRAEALNTFVRSLKNLTELAERKHAELDTKLDGLADERRDVRREVRTLERTMRDAMRDEDYSNISANQELLVERKAEHSAIEIDEKQTRDIVRIFEDLLEIADELDNAISQNRRALLTGVKVTELPGIEGLDVLEEGNRWGIRR